MSAPLSVVVLRIPGCMEQQSYTECLIKLQKVLVMNSKSRSFARVTSSSFVASTILDGASASASYITITFPKQQCLYICCFLSATVLHLRSTLLRIYLIRSNEMQQYAGVYLLQNYSTCFGCLSHPSPGAHQTVTAASGTGQCQSNNLPPAWPN